MSSGTQNMSRGQCPTCNGERRSFVRAQYKQSWSNEEDQEYGDSIYSVLECAGCSTLFYQTTSTSTYDIVWNDAIGEWDQGPPNLTHYPPKMIRQKPQWMLTVQGQDSVLSRLLDELYASLNIDLNILPAIGARTVFDRASELLGVNPSLTFEKKLDDLLTQGKIAGEERAILNILVDAGSAAAHRGWTPRATDVSTMMDVVESFLKSNFYLRAHMQQMGSRVPPKPPRQRASATPAAQSTPPAAGAQVVTPAVASGQGAPPTAINGPQPTTATATPSKSNNNAT